MSLISQFLNDVKSSCTFFFYFVSGVTHFYGDSQLTNNVLICSQSSLQDEGLSDFIDHETQFIDFLTLKTSIEMNAPIQTVFEKGGTSGM